jgi:divalent metal cation (Fe/Co/Zn/Cd) transporter
MSPRSLEDPTWSYAILAGSAVFEATSLAISVRQFRRTIQGEPFWRSLAASKDPSLYTVIAEDSVALAGLAAAALGIYGANRWKMPALDAAASIVVGLLLCAVSTLLILQARRLLVGQAVDAATAARIRAIAQGEPSVHRAGWPLTMYLGPDDVLLALDVEFRRSQSAVEIAQAVDRIENAVRESVSEVGRIYIESRRVDVEDASPAAVEE